MKGKQRSAQVSDPSGGVTIEEEECRVQGEKVKNAQEKPQGETEEGKNAWYRSEE